VNDTQSNLEAISDAGFYYHGSEGNLDLGRQLQKLLDDPDLVAAYRKKAKQHAMTHYRWSDVVREHEKLYRRLLGFPAEAVAMSAAHSASNTAD
jgi:glycosyltransferase involved in cell wall biosynthesis